MSFKHLDAPHWASSPAVRWIALLCLCAAYIQGGLFKLLDFPGAVGEMQHFGIAPPALFAALTIVVELGAPVLILAGIWRWAGALALAGFTVFATLVANRFWEMSGQERFMTTNAFFEHIGLIGAFVLVAWMDLRERRAAQHSRDTA
ncbi:DoxX family protein [Pigmentiphaga aceris]|uniref:DoxX family protein n=1 Tax=Pigmentiphaga aceris TaxID=1940612 RepID=A0A5C0AU66_9BURK|nr:DoxX family protein [Pigmentiphaga aceris]QEI05214.1 DoxX family protein [Pigmentiphaga aceris]